MYGEDIQTAECSNGRQVRAGRAWGLGKASQVEKVTEGRKGMRRL